MKIYIPSYGRGDQVRTADLFKGCDYRIVVPESQYRDYSNHHSKDHLIAIPDKKDGNVARKRNAILDIMKNDEGYGIIADDDLLAVWPVMTLDSIDGKRVVRLFENMIEICRGVGAHYCGLNPSSDQLKYRGDFAPFSLTKPFYWLVGIIEDTVRYDETLTRGEDVDFYFRQLQKDHVIVRDNRFTVKRDGRNKGTGIGKVDAKCKEDFQRVQKRWGEQYVRLKRNGTIQGVSQVYKGA
jgi:hypothetical protein